MMGFEVALDAETVAILTGHSNGADRNVGVADLRIRLERIDGNFVHLKTKIDIINSLTLQAK